MNITCSGLYPPDNGFMDCSEGISPSLPAHFGVWCSFRCARGFTLLGSTYRTCTVDGNWTGAETTCIGEYML